MDHDDDADKICQRMAVLRHELSYDVRKVGRSARAMADMNLYVRKFPWATVALAIAAGYLLVPRRKEVVHPDPALLAKMIKQNQVRVETNAGQSSKGVLKNLLAMAVMSTAKIGMNYAVQRLTSTAQPSRVPDESPRAFQHA
jgi:hypothetical protein